MTTPTPSISDRVLDVLYKAAGQELTVAQVCQSGLAEVSSAAVLTCLMGWVEKGIIAKVDESPTRFVYPIFTVKGGQYPGRVDTVPAGAIFLESLMSEDSPFAVMTDFHPMWPDSITLVHRETSSAITVVIVEAGELE